MSLSERCARTPIESTADALDEALLSQALNLSSRDACLFSSDVVGTVYSARVASEKFPADLHELHSALLDLNHHSEIGLL